MRFWHRRGGRREAYGWLLALLALPGEEINRTVRARALYCAGMMVRSQADVVHPLFEESLALARQSNDRYLLSLVLAQLANLAGEAGDLGQSQRYDEESLRISRELGWHWHVAMHTGGIAAKTASRGYLEEARTLAEQGLALMRPLGDLWGTAWLLDWLGQVTYQQGDYATAHACFLECLALRRQLKSKPDIARALFYLGLIAAKEKDPAAWSLLEQALRQWVEIGEMVPLAAALDALADLAIVQEQPERALKLAGAATALRQTVDTPLPQVKQAAKDQMLALARQHLDTNVAEAAWATGFAMTVEDAVAYALAE
jgi:tetratricopeptide (TPR) repeat protein